MHPKHLFILLVIMSCSLRGEELTLLIQTEAWPPFIMQNNDLSASGHDVEILESVLNLMNIKYKLEFIPWKRIISNLKLKKADALLGIISTPERKDFLIFPDEPISSGGYVIFYPKTTVFQFNDLSSLSGKRIGTIGGYSYSTEFHNAKNFHQHPQVGKSALENNFKKMLIDRLDLVIANKLVGLYTADKMQILDQIDYSDRYVSGETQFYLAFSKTEKHKTLAQNFNVQLKNFKQTAEYKKIQTRYGLFTQP